MGPRNEESNCISDSWKYLLALCRTRYVGNCSSVGHDVRLESVVMVRGLKSCDNFFWNFGTLGFYSSEGEITPEKVVTIVYYISWMLNISFTDSYWMHIVLFPMLLCRVLVRLWVGGWVRVRFWCCGSCEMANRCGNSHKRSATLQETVKHHWQNHKESALCVLYGRYGMQRMGLMCTRRWTIKTIPDASTLDTTRHRDTPQPKQPKLSGTPVRCTTAQKVPFDVQEQLNETIRYEQCEQTDLLCDSLADMSLENHHLVQELISIFPDVAKKWMLLGKVMTGVKP